MGKIGVVVKVTIVAGALLGMAGCSDPKDTYRDFLDLQSSVVSTGFAVCSDVEAETNGAGTTEANCHNRTHLFLAPGMSADEIWEIRRDSTLLEMGHMDEKTLAESDDSINYVLIGPGFAVNTIGPDGKNEMEALEKRGGELKSLSPRFFFDKDVSWSKMKGLE